MNEFERAFSLIHNQIKLNIDYNEFKELFNSYAKQIMNGFLSGKLQCNSIIKPLGDGQKGLEVFDEKTNTFIITIDNDIVKSIYNGTNSFNIFTLFHEIAHVYDEFSIDNKDFKDANLKKICVENAIIESMVMGNLFYTSNYESMAIEAHANLIGAQLTRDFYKKCNIELTEEEQKGLLIIEFFSLIKLNDTNRDFKYLFDDSYINNFKMSLNEIINEIKNRYPAIYNNLKRLLGREDLLINSEEQSSEFETKVYSQHAILELSNIINDPLFTSLIEDKTQYRPKI